MVESGGVEGRVDGCVDVVVVMVHEVDEDALDCVVEAPCEHFELDWSKKGIAVFV